VHVLDISSDISLLACIIRRLVHSGRPNLFEGLVFAFNAFALPLFFCLLCLQIAASAIFAFSAFICFTWPKLLLRAFSSLLPFAFAMSSLLLLALLGQTKDSPPPEELGGLPTFKGHLSFPHKDSVFYKLNVRMKFLCLYGLEMCILLVPL
jgi:hypothetical protein